MILMTKKRSLTPYLFLAPALLVIAIFVLYPIVAVVYYSFTDYSIVTPPVWIGLKNFQRLLQDQIFWLALKNSLVYLLVTPVLMILCTILAIVVNRKLRGINAFRAMYYIPVISGSIAVGIAWPADWDNRSCVKAFTGRPSWNREAASSDAAR